MTGPSRVAVCATWNWSADHTRLCAHHFLLHLCRDSLSFKNQRGPAEYRHPRNTLHTLEISRLSIEIHVEIDVEICLTTLNIEIHRKNVEFQVEINAKSISTISMDRRTDQQRQCWTVPARIGSVTITTWCSTILTVQQHRLVWIYLDTWDMWLYLVQCSLLRAV